LTGDGRSSRGFGWCGEDGVKTDMPCLAAVEGSRGWRMLLLSVPGGCFGAEPAREIFCVFCGATSRSAWLGVTAGCAGRVSEPRYVVAAVFRMPAAAEPGGDLACLRGTRRTCDSPPAHACRNASVLRCRFGDGVRAMPRAYSRRG